MPTLIKAGAALSPKCGCYEMRVDSGDSLGPSEETQETGVKENSKCFEISRDFGISSPHTHRKAIIQSV